MLDSTARSLVALGRNALPLKNIRAAENIIDSWLRWEANSVVYIRDKYGNYLWTAKNGTKRRWHQGPQTLYKQYKDGGEWRNLASYPKLDWALALIKTAAEQVPDHVHSSEVLAQVVAEREARAEKKEKAAASREQADFLHRAKVWAAKRVAWENYDLTRSMALTKKADPEALKHLQDLVTVYADGFMDAPHPEPDGSTSPEEAFASVDRPPYLPFIQRIPYIWAEPTEAGPITVRLDPDEGAIGDEVVHVTIGGSKGIEFHSASGKVRPAPVGLRYPEGSRTALLGVLYIRGGALAATRVDTAGSASEDWSPALYELWHRLLRAYGVATYNRDSNPLVRVAVPQ